jgi:hypothetical protein
MIAKPPGGRARSVQDIVAGAVLIGIAVLALYLVNHLPAAGRVGFASGTAPRLFAYGLLGLGAWISIAGFLKEGPGVDSSLAPSVVGLLTFFIVMFAVDTGLNTLSKQTGIVLFDKLSALIGFVIAGAIVAVANGFPGKDRFGMQGPLAILGSVLFFAFTVRDLGLAVTGVPMIVISYFATREGSIMEALIFGSAMTAFCCVLFPGILGQPIPLWPTF